MTPDEFVGIQAAFEKSIEPMATALVAIQRKQDEHSSVLASHTQLLNEHSRLLDEQSQLLRNIDGRLVRVESLLDGVEILVRTKTGS